MSYPFVFTEAASLVHPCLAVRFRTLAGTDDTVGFGSDFFVKAARRGIGGAHRQADFRPPVWCRRDTAQRTGGQGFLSRVRSRVNWRDGVGAVEAAGYRPAGQG